MISMNNKPTPSELPQANLTVRMVTDSGGRLYVELSGTGIPPGDTILLSPRTALELSVWLTQLASDILFDDEEPK